MAGYDFTDAEKARVLAKVEQADGCWFWIAGVNNVTGYGQFTYRREGKVHSARAHRAVLEILTGQVPPDGMTVDHLCMVKHCVRPDHLEIVTQGENVRRAIAVLGTEHLSRHQKAKTHCPQGHPYEGENLRLVNGRRVCRTCRNATFRRWYAEHGRAYHARRKAAREATASARKAVA